MHQQASFDNSNDSLAVSGIEEIKRFMRQKIV